MFNRAFPHALITVPNPVFDRELRRIGWPRTPEELSLFRQHSMIALHALVWGIFLCGLPVNLWHQDTLLALVVTANIAVSLIADLNYAAITIGSMNRDVESAHWDVLRLTPLRFIDILTAKLASAQIRAWRLMILETTVRLISVEFIALIALVSLFVRAFAFSRLAALVPITVLGITLLLEPLWRMRALVTLSIAIGLQVHNAASAYFTALTAVIGLLVIRLVALSILVGLIFGLGLAYASLFPVCQNVYCLFAMSLPGAIVFLLHGCYAGVRRWAFRHAAAGITSQE